MIPATMLQTLDELAPLFGLPFLRPDRHGVMTLRLGDTRRLSLEFQEHRGEHAAILCLMRPVSAHIEAVLEHALRLCEARNGLPLTVRAGLTEANGRNAPFLGDIVSEDVLVLMTFFTERAFTVSNVMQGVQTLADLHRRIAAR